MEALWEATDRVFYLIGLLAVSATIEWLYRAYLSRRRDAVWTGAAYTAAMLVMYLIPTEVSGSVAYLFGIAAVLVTSILLEREGIPEKIFLALTLYLARWIAAGIALRLWDMLAAATYLSPKLYDAPERQYLWFVISYLTNVISEIALLLFEEELFTRVYLGRSLFSNAAQGGQSMASRHILTWREFILLAAPYLAMTFGYLYSNFLLTAYIDDMRQVVWEAHGRERWLLTVYHIVCFFAMLAVLLAYRRVRDAQENRLQNALLAQQTAELKRHIGAVEAVYEDMRGLRHDMRHNMMLLSELYGRGEKAEAERYLAAWQAEIDVAADEISTGNPVTDRILSETKRQAAAEGIELEADFRYPRGCNIETYDISIILMNALSNAIEACNATAEKAGNSVMAQDNTQAAATAENDVSMKISIASRQHRSQYIIIVRNSFDGELDIDVDSGLPRTTKDDGGLHGYGLSNIRRIAEKYSGMAELSQHDGEVELAVMLLV